MSILRNFAQITKEENKVRSIDLVNWINEVRKEEGIKSVLRTNDFHAKIESYNQLMQSRDMRKIPHIFYEDTMNRKQKTYLLSKHEAMIFAATESNIVKAMVIQYMDNLEFELKIAVASKEHTKSTNKTLVEVVKEYKPDEVNSEMAKINSFINMTVAKKYGLKQNVLCKENMTSEQLEFRAEIEDKWIVLYKGKKSGIKKNVEKEVL